MTKKDYLEFHKSCTEKMLNITKIKNADYTGNNSNPFANFSFAEYFGICTTEQGILLRMCDKMARISSFMQKGLLEVKDESVEDTLLDLANYCLLFAGYLKSKGNNKEF